MGRRAKPEEVIAKLREVEVRLSRGETTGQAVRAIGVTEQNYYRWRKEYGGLQVDQVKRMCVIDEYIRECLAIRVTVPRRRQQSCPRRSCRLTMGWRLHERRYRETAGLTKTVYHLSGAGHFKRMRIQEE